MLRNVLVNNMDETDLPQTVLSMLEPSTGVSYFVKGISGIGPTDAAVVTAPYASGDDNYFQSARRGGRNVVLKIGYDPNYAKNETITTLKYKLYSIFPPGERVRLWFDDDELPDIVTYGYVDKVEPNPFSPDPEIQVSVIVPKADMFAPTETTKNIADRATVAIGYDGTAKAFVEVTCDVTEPFTDVVVTDQKGNSVRVETTAGFEKGDKFYMSTEQGNKIIYRRRSGVNVSLLDSMTSSENSLDHILRPRDNKFTVRTNAAASGKNIFVLKYTKRYLGV